MGYGSYCEKDPEGYVMARITVRLDKEQNEILNKMKEETLESKGSMVRRAIRDYMNRNMDKLRR